MRMQTSIRVEKEFYEEAREVFKKLGLSFGDAVNIFLAKVAMEKGIPFDLKIPSKELEKRIHNIENNKNIQTYETTKKLFDDLGI
jgi:DNA-damage-inducible protein J